MTVYSYSRLDAYASCPLKYRYRYIDKLKVETEGVEAFVGNRVHEVLEDLYGDTLFSRTATLQDLLREYEENWEKSWHDKVTITKKGRTADDYRALGRRCIENYYRRYKPFDHGTTIGLEKKVEVDLEGDRRYRIAGYIDRLTQVGEGDYEIHDYKTSSRLPEQSKLDRDWQLAIYQMAVERMWPDVKRVELVWHYLAFDREFRSRRSPEQIVALKGRIRKRINEIESALEFPPKKSGLCAYCDFQPICPLWKHLLEVESLPEEKRAEEDGVKLVDRFARVKDDIKRLETEKAELEGRIIKLAKEEGVQALRGSHHTVSLKVSERISFPAKTRDPKGHQELEDLLRGEGKWAEVSTLSSSLLEKALESGAWSPTLVEAIRAYQKIEEKVSLRLGEL